MMSQQAPDPEYTLRGCDGPVTSLLFLESSKPSTSSQNPVPGILLCGTEKGTIYVWDLSRRRIQQQINAHTSSVLGLFRVTPMIGSDEQSITVSDGLVAGVTSTSPSYHNNPPDHVTQTVDSTGGTHHVISQGRDGFLHIWSIQHQNWTIIRSYPCGASGFCSGSVFDIEGLKVIAVSVQGQGEVAVFKVDTGETSSILSTDKHGIQTGMCMCLTFCSRHSTLVAGYEDGRLILWDVTSDNLLSHAELHTSPVTCLDYSNDLNKGVSGSVDNDMITWTITDTSELSKLRTININNPGLNCVKYRPDVKIFVCGGWDSKIRVFSGKSSKPLAVLSGHRESVQSVGFSLDNTIAAGGKDGFISVWGIYK